MTGETKHTTERDVGRTNEVNLNIDWLSGGTPCGYGA